MAIKKLFYTKVGKLLTIEVVELRYSMSAVEYEIGSSGLFGRAEIVDSLEKAFEIHNAWVREAIKEVDTYKLFYSKVGRTLTVNGYLFGNVWRVVSSGYVNKTETVSSFEELMETHNTHVRATIAIRELV